MSLKRAKCDKNAKNKKGSGLICFRTLLKMVVCVCLCSHSDDLLSIVLAGAGPPAFDSLLFKQRHQFFRWLVEHLKGTLLWRLCWTQHVVQVHHQVT